MQMSPEHVPENTISSDQPYTAHIMVSVFPMFPLRPIRPPPEERRRQSSHNKERALLVRVLASHFKKYSYQPCAKILYVSPQLWWACQGGRDLFSLQISCPCFHWKTITSSNIHGCNWLIYHVNFILKGTNQAKHLVMMNQVQEHYVEPFPFTAMLWASLRLNQNYTPLLPLWILPPHSSLYLFLPFVIFNVCPSHPLLFFSAED